MSADPPGDVGRPIPLVVERASRFQSIRGPAAGRRRARRTTRESADRRRPARLSRERAPRPGRAAGRRSRPAAGPGTAPRGAGRPDEEPSRGLLAEGDEERAGPGPLERDAGRRRALRRSSRRASSSRRDQASPARARRAARPRRRGLERGKLAAGGSGSGGAARSRSSRPRARDRRARRGRRAARRARRGGEGRTTPSARRARIPPRVRPGVPVEIQEDGLGLVVERVPGGDERARADLARQSEERLVAQPPGRGLEALSRPSPPRDVDRPERERDAEARRRAARREAASRSPASPRRPCATCSATTGMPPWRRPVGEEDEERRRVPAARARDDDARRAVEEARRLEVPGEAVGKAHREELRRAGEVWWRWADSNRRHGAYETPATTTVLHRQRAARGAARGARILAALSWGHGPNRPDSSGDAAGDEDLPALRRGGRREAASTAAPGASRSSATPAATRAAAPTSAAAPAPRRCSTAATTRSRPRTRRTSAEPPGRDRCAQRLSRSMTRSMARRQTGQKPTSSRVNMMQSAAGR